MPPTYMLQGTVAMIDALGFKGAWGDEKKPSMEVLQSLRRIGKAAKIDANKAGLQLTKGALPDELMRFIKQPAVSVVQLSDTLVVAAGRRPRLRAIWKRHAASLEKLGYDAPYIDHAVDGYLRFLVCKCVCRILRVAALCDPAVAYRGVVTAGRFTIQQNLLLGPAVDEAAELMNLADGPFVWLAPTAGRLEHLFRESRADEWQRLTLKYRIPLKGGQRLPTRALNPFALCSEVEQKKARQNLLRRMNSTRIDVSVKRGNAVRFFDTAETFQRYTDKRDKSKATQRAEEAKSVRPSDASESTG
jgi:hypothetical protein